MSMACMMALSGGTYSSAPSNTVAPSVTGTAQQGSTLSCSTGTWKGVPTPTYAYQWQHGTTNIAGATTSSYVISEAYAGETIRCVVTATNVIGSVSANSNATASVAAVGQYMLYGWNNPVDTTWTAPAGVTSVSVVTVGQADYNNGSSSSAGGGGLAYKNNYTVIPGNTYRIVMGGFNGGVSDTFFVDAATCCGKRGVGATGGGWTGTGGGYGGDAVGSRGGGAGGYSGTGGSSSAGAGGGGGSGGDYHGGGGTWLKGQGSNGAMGTNNSSGTNARDGGGGGSDGPVDHDTANWIWAGSWGCGGSADNPGIGGAPGGGSSLAINGTSKKTMGALRIIWPGTTRQFPSTNTGDM